MLVFLIHVRDPQFYALPAKTRAKNGNIRVMGFPPIGIMSLSSVVKQAGHECVMFDQANPDTPNDVIIEGNNPESCDGDCHLLVVQQGACMLFEGYACEHRQDG